MPYRPFSDAHPVAGAIRTGDNWFYAWASQKATPGPKIARATKIPKDRLSDLWRGAEPTDAEVEILARLWKIEPGDIVASIAFSR